VGIICLDPFKIDTFIGFFNILIGAYALTMGIVSFIFGCFHERNNNPPTGTTVKNVSPPAVNRV